MIHRLKTDPLVFDAVKKGEKTFEIRFDDRGFEVGDMLVLRRTEFSAFDMDNYNKPLRYTGECEHRTITYILRGPAYGLNVGWVIMSIK